MLDAPIANIFLILLLNAGIVLFGKMIYDSWYFPANVVKKMMCEFRQIKTMRQRRNIRQKCPFVLGKPGGGVKFRVVKDAHYSLRAFDAREITPSKTDSSYSSDSKLL